MGRYYNPNFHKDFALWCNYRALVIKNSLSLTKAKFRKKIRSFHSDFFSFLDLVTVFVWAALSPVLPAAQCRSFEFLALFWRKN